MANEKRLIDANAYESNIRKLSVQYGDGTYPGDREAMIYDEALVDALYALNEAPTVDAVEVVHGKWVHSGRRIPNGVDWWHCSECGKSATGVEIKYNYCPNCGAKMDGGNDDG